LHRHHRGKSREHVQDLLIALLHRRALRQQARTEQEQQQQFGHGHLHDGYRTVQHEADDHDRADIEAHFGVSAMAHKTEHESAMPPGNIRK
jgi:hypothetical protein